MYFADKTKHNWFIVALILSNILIYVTMLGFNILASFPINSTTKLFPTDVGGISNDYYIEVTPASWVFSTVWTIIFVWNALWLIYAFINIFRRLKDNTLFYRKFDFLNFGVFIAFIVNNLSIIAWLFLWSNKFIGWALLLIVFCVIPLNVALFIFYRKLDECKEDLKEHKMIVDLVFIRILPQNGLATFATWLTLATNLNFATFLAYECGAEQDAASTVILFIILTIAVVYFVIENFIWQRYLLYNFSPWFVINFALLGSVIKNYDASNPSRNNIITIILLIITFLLAIGKIVLFILYKTACRRFANKKVFHINQTEDIS
ncbi:hypothetical protein BpHYR1_049974 [Brachionus plicatilis]|uniref:Uncharacterized protein n=1 Tax=Brachionus plicatilis TaxID=10195 RepID=A0A3M7Q284_BRAPC|nr:hypothetical protein BpHYR1_049974 [Brachionus plicatilis]